MSVCLTRDAPELSPRLTRGSFPTGSASSLRPVATDTRRLDTFERERLWRVHVRGCSTNKVRNVTSSLHFSDLRLRRKYFAYNFGRQRGAQESGGAVEALLSAHTRGIKGSMDSFHT